MTQNYWLIFWTWYTLSVLKDTKKWGEYMKSNVFLGALKVRGKNVKWIVDEMKSRGVNISESTMYKKLRGESEFTALEIKTITEIMDFSKEQMYDIFFKELVS